MALIWIKSLGLKRRDEFTTFNRNRFAPIATMRHSVACSPDFATARPSGACPALHSNIGDVVRVARRPVRLPTSENDAGISLRKECKREHFILFRN
jgi:hypothetical protein